MRKFKTALLSKINLVFFVVEKYPKYLSFKKFRNFLVKLQITVFINYEILKNNKAWFQLVIWGEKKSTLISKIILISILCLLNGIPWKWVSKEKKSLRSTDTSDIPDRIPSRWQLRKQMFLNQSNNSKNFQWDLALKMLSKDKIFKRWQFTDQTPECKSFLNKMEVMKEKTIPLSEQTSILKWNSLQY